MKYSDFDAVPPTRKPDLQKTLRKQEKHLRMLITDKLYEWLEDVMRNKDEILKEAKRQGIDPVDFLLTLLDVQEKTHEIVEARYNAHLKTDLEEAKTRLSQVSA